MRRELHMQENYVYRLFDKTGRLLYVGKTTNVPVRLIRHQRDKPWWPDVTHVEVSQHVNRKEATTVEQRTIRNLDPIHNVRFTPRDPSLKKWRGNPDRVVMSPSSASSMKLMGFG